MTAINAPVSSGLSVAHIVDFAAEHGSLPDDARPKLQKLLTHSAPLPADLGARMPGRVIGRVATYADLAERLLSLPDYAAPRRLSETEKRSHFTPRVGGDGVRFVDDGPIAA